MRRSLIVAIALVCAFAAPAFASLSCDNNGRCIADPQPAANSARHVGRQHAARTARHAAEPEVRKGEIGRLIATINDKLKRYVRPTGKCAGGSEQLATYYWQGHRTATGERFNPDGLSVASRSLAFGTRLHITNPHNGRSVTVRVNDRGPYTIAKLDLSRGAASAIGMRTSIYVCVSAL